MHIHVLATSFFPQYHTTMVVLALSKSLGFAKKMKKNLSQKPCLRKGNKNLSKYSIVKTKSWK